MSFVHLSAGGLSVLHLPAVASQRSAGHSSCFTHALLTHLFNLPSAHWNLPSSQTLSAAGLHLPAVASQRSAGHSSCFTHALLTHFSSLPSAHWNLPSSQISGVAGLVLHFPDTASHPIVHFSVVYAPSLHTWLCSP